MTYASLPAGQSTPGGVIPPPPGAMANYTYTASTVATMPLVTSLADGTFVYVASNRSWYRSDLAGNTYRRESFADPTWMLQAAWGLDTVNGDDENIGSVASPLKTVAEFVARLPQLSQSVTLTIAAGSAIASFVWNPTIVPGVGNITITIQGVVTLGTNQVVTASTNTTAVECPSVDVGAALASNTFIQQTSGVGNGATAYLLSLVAGTNKRTSAWRSAAGSLVAPPAVGQTIATVTLPTCVFLSLSVAGGINVVNVKNLAIATLDDTLIQFCKPAVCLFVNVVFISLGFWSFAGCGFASAGPQNFGPSAFFDLCAVRAGGAFTEAVADSGGQTSWQNSVIDGTGLVVRDNGYCNLNSNNTILNGVNALVVVRGGIARIAAALGGGNNSGVGCAVDAGAIVLVNPAVTPTVTGAVELRIDGAATSLPAIGVAAAATTTWAQWVANGRNGIGANTLARVSNH